jgi:hypothetical protein
MGPNMYSSRTLLKAKKCGGIAVGSEKWNEGRVKRAAADILEAHRWVDPNLFPQALHVNFVNNDMHKLCVIGVGIHVTVNASLSSIQISG